jgi:hypothetical protein
LVGCLVTFPLVITSSNSWRHSPQDLWPRLLYMTFYFTCNVYLWGSIEAITDQRTIRYCVRFEIFTVVTMKNAVFWDVMPCVSCKNQCSSETVGLTRATQPNIPADNNLLYLILDYNFTNK